MTDHWVSPVDRARMGGVDLMTRLKQLETDTNLHDSTVIGPQDLADITDDIGLLQTGELYFGSGDPHDLTTTPLGAWMEALGFHLFNQIEVARFGDLKGFLDYVTDVYGIGIGNAQAYLSYDPVNGLRIKGTLTVTNSNPYSYDIWDEDSSAAADGVTTRFFTLQAYISGTLQVFLNGQFLRGGGTDYSEGTTTDFYMKAAPQTGDVMICNYVRADTGGAVYNEAPTGSINGTNTTFTLLHAPRTGSLEVFLNGLLLDLGDNFTTGITAVNFVTAPVSGDKIKFAYNLVANSKLFVQEVPTGSINGSNTVFTLAHNYVAGTPIIVLNGIKQTITNDYTESGVNQFTMTAAPQTGDQLWVTYQGQ